jgi:hypothetical protein
MLWSPGLCGRSRSALTVPQPQEGTFHTEIKHCAHRQADDCVYGQPAVHRPLRNGRKPQVNQVDEFLVREIEAVSLGGLGQEEGNLR